MALIPEYVRMRMRLEVGTFSLSLLGPDPEPEPGQARSPEPNKNVFAGITINGMSLVACFRPDSIKLSGSIASHLSVEARPVMGGGRGTKLLELTPSAGSLGKEHLVRFQFDTLTHQTEVSGRLVVQVAAITVQAVPAPLADVMTFFAPADDEDSHDDASPRHAEETGSASKGKERRKRLLNKAKNMTKKLGAGGGGQAESNVVAATQRKSYMVLQVDTKSLELVVPEDGGSSGGAFHLTIAAVAMSSQDHNLIPDGMFDRSCHAVKAAVEANTRAIETARDKKWCQNVTVELSGASLSYATKPVSEEADRVCIVQPFAVTAHLALAQQPGPLGPPESYLAATVLVPSIDVSATADCLARLVRLYDTALKPLFSKPTERDVVAPHPIKELPHEDLDSFVNLSSRANVRVWVQIGAGPEEIDGTISGITLRTPAVSADGAVGVVVKVPSITVGYLSNANERTDRQPRKSSATGPSPSILDTYIESNVHSIVVSFVDKADAPVGPAVISVSPASAGLGVRLEFASQVGWQPGVADPYAQWPICMSEDDARAWQCGESSFQLVSLHIGDCVGWASLDSVKVLKGIRDEVLAQKRDEWPAGQGLEVSYSDPSHRLVTLSASQLSLNCYLNQQDETAGARSSGSSQHACMILSDIGLSLEVSVEPITTECERESVVSIGAMRATLSQDGVDLDLVPDAQDDQVQIKLKFGGSTSPLVEEGIPLQVGGGLALADAKLRPLTMEVDMHAIMFWVYPSLIRLLHELLAKAPPTAMDERAQRSKELAKQQAMRPMKVYVNISDCDVLLSTTDPATSAKGTQLVVGVHLQSLLIPPTSIGMGEDTEAQSFDLTIGDENGGLRIYTGRLGSEGITAKRTLLEDVVMEVNLEHQRDGYALTMESGNICANLDGREATALLGLATLSKLWSSGDAMGTSQDVDVDMDGGLDDSSEEEDYMMDQLEMGGYRTGRDASAERRANTPFGGFKIIKGTAQIPCIRVALSTDGQDVMALLIQSIQAEIGRDEVEASIFAVALSDSGASERGLCVVGMGPWAELQEEPAIGEGLEEAEEMAVEDRAVQLSWLNKPMDETSNPLDGDEAGDMIDVEIAKVHVNLTPRFCRRCVDWVSTVWEDREEFEEEVTVDARPPEAEEGDWVLREDHCIETTVYLGTSGVSDDSFGGMKRHNRLFVERPAGVKHNTVTLSGGSLSVSVDPQGGKTQQLALVYVGADVNLVLQDVNVENFDAALFTLGPGATVSGSVNLDGTEVWDAGASSKTMKARRKRLRKKREHLVFRAAIQAHELRVTSVHSFGSFTFEFALSLDTTVQDHHTRVEVEGKRISLLSFGVEEEATQLFFMPQAQVMYDTSSDDGRAFIQVDLGPVPIVLSNRIGKAAYWAATQWMDVVKAASELARELSKAEPKEMRLRRLEQERKKRQEAAMATLITNIQCPEIEVLMLNDTSSLENGGKQLAMRLNIQNISTDSHRIYMPDADNEEGRMHNQGKVEFSIALDVMNPSNAAWEPLCERFPFQLDANRDGPKEVVVDIQVGKKAAPITELNGVPQTGSVEISVTAPMLDVFGQTADYWVRSLSAKPPVDTAEASFLATQKLSSEVTELCSDLKLQNDLPDLRLQYKCGPAFHTSFAEGELQPLAAGEQQTLNLKYASESDERYLVMTMDGFSTERFQVERVMSQVVSFKPKDMIDIDEARVVVSVVQNVGNLKVISIRSPVFVSNKCTEDITMQLIGTEGETATVIAPGKGVSLPPTSKSMKIRPARPGMEAVYGWSDVQWRSPIDIAPQKAVVCDAAPGMGEIPHNYCIQRIVEKSDARLQGLTIEVFAPIVMVNLLPVRLQYFVYKSMTGTSSLLEGMMEQGAEDVLYTIPADAYIEYKCEGYKVGKRLKIPALRDMQVKIDLPDKDDGMLELQMQSEESSAAGYKLTVWCPYWVVNHTGLRLRYAADDTFAYNAFPGAAASDFPGEPFMVSQTKMAVAASACEGMAAKNRIAPDNNCAALNSRGEREYETGWSKAFSTGSVGTAGVFCLTDKAENSWKFDIGTSIKLGVGKFRRTKVVMLHAQYAIVNQMSQPIAVRQAEADLAQVLTVQPGQTAPLYWPHRDRNMHVVLRVAVDGHMWSEPLTFESAHNLGLPMHVRNSHELVESPPFVIAVSWKSKATVTSTADEKSDKLAELIAGQVVKMKNTSGDRVEVAFLDKDGTEKVGWVNNATSKGNPVLEPFDTELLGSSFSGFLEKMGEVGRTWKKRHFVYSWPNLQYFESLGGEYKGAIDMRTVTAVQTDKKTTQLNLPTEGRTYQLKAPNQKEFMAWKSLLLCSLVPMTGETTQVTADTVVDGGSQKLTVCAADPLAPAYIIQNHVDNLCAWVSQKDSISGYEMMIGPNQSKSWVWPEPVGACRVNFRLKDTRPEKQGVEIEKDYGLDKIKEHKPLIIGDHELVFISNVRGLTKVTHIYSRRRKPGASHARTARRNSVDLTNGAGGEGFNANELGEMKLELKIPQIGISLVGKRLMGSDWEALGLNTDIIYLSVLDLELRLAQQMNGEQSMELIADWIQVDNGNRTCPFPVAFRATPTDGPHKALFQFSVVKCAKEMGPNAFRMIQVLLQEADVVLDEELVAALMMFASAVKFGDEDAESAELHTEDFALSVSSNESSAIVKAETIFCEFLQIHPISFHITYASSAGIDMGELGVSSFLSNNPLLDVLANVDAAPLKLNALMLSDLVTTKDQASELVIKHYKRQGVLELYKLMGTVDLLGNPMGLVTGVASGVVDFFYEPGQALMTNPSELGTALGKGTMSLIGGTIGGSMNTVSKMTGAVGKGLTTLTMDESYITQRRSVQQAEDATDGLMKGVEHLGSGMFKGVTGIVTNPYKEGKKGGASGFMKGVGKGLVGAVVKPTAGVLDLASDLSSGIKATATQAGTHKALRARPPRAPVYDPKAPLSSYDIHKALALDMVIRHSLHKTFANQMKEKLMDCVKIESGAKAFLLTDQRVMIIAVDAGIDATPTSIPLHRAFSESPCKRLRLAQLQHERP